MYSTLWLCCAWKTDASAPASVESAKTTTKRMMTTFWKRESSPGLRAGLALAVPCFWDPLDPLLDAGLFAMQTTPLTFELRASARKL